MSKKQKTLLGTAFRCSTCNQVFIAGTLGMDALTERVTKHWHNTGHVDIPPINPPVGMYCVQIGTGEQVGVTFDGVDKDKWLKEMRELGRRVSAFKPAWDLKS